MLKMPPLAESAVCLGFDDAPEVGSSQYLTSDSHMIPGNRAYSRESCTHAHLYHWQSTMRSEMCHGHIEDVIRHTSLFPPRTTSEWAEAQTSVSVAQYIAGGPQDASLIPGIRNSSN